MSSRYKYQRIIYKEEDNTLRLSRKCRLICCDDYIDEPPSYILYNSKEDFLNALEKEKTRKIGGTRYGDDVTGYELLINRPITQFLT